MDYSRERYLTDEGMEIVLEVLEEIEGIVTSLGNSLSVEVFTFYLWKSRARGDCREDSDIDIWMEVSDRDIERVSELNRKLVDNPLPWYEHKGRRVIWDFRFGVGRPEGTYYSYQSLRKLRARLLSS
jgi:predicted nucleotidyltransferase